MFVRLQHRVRPAGVVAPMIGDPVILRRLRPRAAGPIDLAVAAGRATHQPKKEKHATQQNHPSTKRVQ